MNATVGGELEVAWQAGATLARYRLLSRMALGVRSEIWRAKITGAEGFEKPIALKTMRPSASRMPELVRMFTTEASIAAHLYHPNIVQLVDCGNLADRYYMAMEFVDGLTMRQVMQRLRDLGQPFPLRLLVHIAVQTCNALHYAHELFDGDGWLGFLHRDLNPDNLMVAATGAAKIVDFGAARLASTPGPTYPFVGDVQYAAPERIRGLAEDRRGDIYSLGVMLYEAAVGVQPFAPGHPDVVSRVLHGKPRPPRELAPELPPELSNVILRAMALAPADRYQSADLMAADLQAFVDELPVAPGRTDSVTTALGLIFQLSPTVSPPLRERFAPDAYDSHDDETSPAGLSLFLPSKDTAASDAASDAATSDAATEISTDSGVTVVSGEDTSGRAPAAAVPATWSFQPRPASAEPIPDIFVRPQRTPFDGISERDRPFAPEGGFSPDFFSIRRGGAAEREPAAAAPRREPDRPSFAPSEARAPEAPASEAVRCFDRGLAYVGERRYVLAVDEWQRALALDPENRLYRSNLRRLQAQLEGRSQAPKTETP